MSKENERINEVANNAWSLCAQSGVENDPEKIKGILQKIINKIDEGHTFLGGVVCLGVDEGDGVSLINAFFGTPHIARATKLSVDSMMAEPLLESYDMAVTACRTVEHLRHHAHEEMAKANTVTPTTTEQ